MPATTTAARKPRTVRPAAGRPQVPGLDFAPLPLGPAAVEVLGRLDPATTIDELKAAYRRGDLDVLDADPGFLEAEARRKVEEAFETCRRLGNGAEWRLVNWFAATFPEMLRRP